MYVVDTDVLSQSSPGDRRYPRIHEWLSRNGSGCYLSAVTILEVSYGATWLEYKGAHKKATALTKWLETVLATHHDRILSLDERTARRAGELIAIARAKGVSIGSEDAIIAASAELNQMTVLTMNERHFSPMGVPFKNPAKGLPAEIGERG